MTGAVLVMYASVLEAVRRLGGDSTVGGLLAVAVVAVVIHPAHSWLRQRVERRVHGYRGDPHRALRMLADATEAAPQETLTASISATIAEAVRVDWARIDTGSGMDDGNHRFPLEHRGEVIGSLVVASPPGGRFGAKDLALLRDLARYAAVVVFADRHHGALRDSRARIVAAREEERRRLRRDLHDGIGPSLAAVVLKLNAAETRTDAQERHAILKEARSEVKEAIDEVRRLVDDLRPPAIDEVGLLAAIRQRALGLSEAVVFEVRGPTAMPDLPAAVETAAFRIAAEAMTNVARHASATRCEVDITITGDEFAITVTDNGRGAASTVRSGMGWESMRRARGVVHADERGPGDRAVGPRGPSSPAVTGSSGRGGREGMIRLLIVDDHPAFRRGLELMLSDVDDIEVVAQAASGEEAVELAAQATPDVVLMDLRMPGLDGIESTRRLKRLHSSLSVVVLTMFEDDASVFAAMRAGARGYVLKGADQDEIERAVRAAAAGEAIFGPAIADRVILHFAQGGDHPRATFPSLTQREREVLSLIANGKGNAAIAHELGINLKTVRNHVSNVFTKLHVSDRASAIVKARESGMAGE